MATTFKLPHKNRRKIHAVSIATGFVLAAVCAPRASAASLTWDTNGATTDGFGTPENGTWDNNITAEWLTSGNYGTGAAAKWNNLVENTAQFITRNDGSHIGTPGIVSLNSAILADGITLTIKAGTVGGLWTFNANAPADTLSTFNAGGTFALNASGATSSGLITAIIADHSGSGLSMTGATAGKIALAANETYTGATVINNGILSLTGTSGTSAGTLNSTSGITVNSGTFNLDDSAGAGVASRFAAVTLNGTLSVTGNAANDTADSSTGGLTLGGSTNYITITPGANQDSSLTFTGLTRTTSSLVFTGANVGSTTPGLTRSHLFFTTAPALTGTTTPSPAGGTDTAILPYATVTDTATANTYLATYDSTAGVGIRGLIDATETTNGTGVTANKNVLVSGTTSTGAVNVQSLTLRNTGTAFNFTLTGALTNSSDAFLSTGTVTNTITGGTVALGTKPGYFHIVRSLTINSALSGNAGFIKDGTGTLSVGGSNTAFSGDVTIANGTLTLNSGLTVTSLTLGSGTFSGSVGTATGSLTVTGGHITVLGTGGSNIVTNNNTNFGVGGTGTPGVVTISGGSLSLANNLHGDSGLTILGTGNVGFANNNLNGKLTGTFTVGALGSPGPAVTWTFFTYTGGDVVINSGSISLGSTRPSLGWNGANLTMHGGTLSNFDGCDLNFTNLNADSSTAAITSGNAANLITVTGSGTFAGVISDDGSHATSLSKTTGGTFILSGNNTYFGATTITGGTLTAAAEGTMGTNGPLGKGNVAVSGGTLNSSVANVNLNGNLSMDSGILDPNTQSTVGTFTLNTNKNFTMSGGTLAVNIATASSFDQIIDKAGSTTGNFMISGGTLDLGLGGSNSALYLSTYQLLQGFNGANSVASLAIVNYDTTDWTANFDNTGLLSFTAVPPQVPEPASLALLGLGALGLIKRRRNR